MSSRTCHILRHLSPKLGTQHLSPCHQILSPTLVTNTCHQSLSPPKLVTNTCHQHLSPTLVANSCHQHFHQHLSATNTCNQLLSPALVTSSCHQHVVVAGLGLFFDPRCAGCKPISWDTVSGLRMAWRVSPWLAPNWTVLLVQLVK